MPVRDSWIPVPGQLSKCTFAREERVIVLAKRQSIVPSQSLLRWRGEHAEALDQIVAAHRAFLRSKRRPQHASEQLVHVYALLVASKFQEFCRALHSEMADFVTRPASSHPLRTIYRQSLTGFRQLDRGNAHAGSLANDFARFEMDLWKELKMQDGRSARRRVSLESLNAWRNAIAHQDFRNFAGRHLSLRDVWTFRGACSGLATTMDRIARKRLRSLVGQAPW